LIRKASALIAWSVEREDNLHA